MCRKTVKECFTLTGCCQRNYVQALLLASGNSCNLGKRYVEKRNGKLRENAAIRFAAGTNETAVACDKCARKKSKNIQKPKIPKINYHYLLPISLLCYLPVDCLVCQGANVPSPIHLLSVGYCKLGLTCTILGRSSAMSVQHFLLAICFCPCVPQNIHSCHFSNSNSNPWVKKALLCHTSFVQ